MKKILSTLLLFLAPLSALAEFGPIYSCPGPYACILSTYEGIQFPDGTHQSTAASDGGGIVGVGTLDSEITPSDDGAVISGSDIIMQSASSTKPGLVNVSAQSFAGVKTFGANLVVNNGHLKSTQSVVPTAAPNANAGTGATCSIVNGTDVAGQLNLTTTAVSPSTGAQCAITFHTAYAVAPICLFTPHNGNSATFAVASAAFVTTSTTVMTVSFGSLDAAGHAYQWNYHCMETQ